MHFVIIHELRGISTPASGRMRLRSDSPLGPAQMNALKEALTSLDGIHDVRVNPLLGSLLIFYDSDESRTEALTLLLGAADANCQFDIPETLSAAEISSMRGFLPLIRYVFVRPFLPLVVRTASCVLGAIPFLLKGVIALLNGRLSVDVLDAAAIGTSLMMRDFRTVSMLILLLGLGETLEQWTRRRSMATLTESLALNVENVWKIVDNEEVSVPLAQVNEGDLIVVRTGGSIPVDGEVVEGEGLVNQSSMTGEPLGVLRSAG
ncbi:MAG: heavy metal translocating P-type ATPase, partial [Desulfovibrio sp.]|nr:heavy metal translocating P-type ATPase [Desulfovibrio sp.]